jgi:hypothetical protein
LRFALRFVIVQGNVPSSRGKAKGERATDSPTRSGHKNRLPTRAAVVNYWFSHNETPMSAKRRGRIRVALSPYPPGTVVRHSIKGSNFQVVNKACAAEARCRQHDEFSIDDVLLHWRA